MKKYIYLIIIFLTSLTVLKRDEMFCIKYLNKHTFKKNTLLKPGLEPAIMLQS